jgi:hypothetical protein
MGLCRSSHSQRPCPQLSPQNLLVSYLLGSSLTSHLSTIYILIISVFPNRALHCYTRLLAIALPFEQGEDEQRANESRYTPLPLTI